MKEEKPKINCSIFKKQEPIIKGITEKINKVNGVRAKAKLSEELQKEVEVLFSCPDYDKDSLDCKNCRFIATLRKKVTGLIIKTKKLA